MCFVFVCACCTSVCLVCGFVVLGGLDISCCIGYFGAWSVLRVWVLVLIWVSFGVLCYLVSWVCAACAIYAVL